MNIFTKIARVGVIVFIVPVAACAQQSPTRVAVTASTGAKMEANNREAVPFEFCSTENGLYGPGNTLRIAVLLFHKNGEPDYGRYGMGFYADKPGTPLRLSEPFPASTGGQVTVSVSAVHYVVQPQGKGFLIRNGPSGNWTAHLDCRQYVAGPASPLS